MKKKLIIGITASLFAVATVFNMGLLSFNKQSDATLEAISVMTKAAGEGSIAYGWTHANNTICTIPYGKCYVSDQDPSQGGYY